MNNDPLSYVSKNDPLKISADKANAWTEAARWVRAQKNNGGGEVLPDSLVPSIRVLVRNDTGDDLDEFSVLRITDWVISPATYPLDVQSSPVLAGATPNATTNLVVITQEPIADGAIGVATLAGHAVVDILVNDAAHEYATPISGDNTKLTSAATGPIRIIEWETSGSTRRAEVLIVNDATSAGATARKNSTGSTYGPRSRFNFIEGTGITLTLADDSTDDEIDLTIATSSGAFGANGARVYHNADQSVATATTVTLAFNSERYDSDGYHDNVTNNSRLTVPTGLDGKHLIGAQVNWGSAIVGTFSLQILLNGATVIAKVQIENQSNYVSTVYDLAVGDYVQVQVLHSDGGSVDVKYLTNYSPEFWIVRLPSSTGPTHNILSTTHPDTLVDSVVLGDLLHGNGTPKWARLAGHTAAELKVLTQTGTGAASAVPAWKSLTGTGGLGVLAWVKTTVSYSTIKVQASDQYTFYTLPAAGAIHAVVLRHTTAYTSGAGGPITQSVGISGDNNRYLGGTVQVDDAPSGTNFNATWPISMNNNADLWDFSNSTAIIVQTTCTDYTTLTAGETDIYLLVSVLP